MNRLTHATKSANLFGAGKDGYTDGVPSVTPATVLNSAAQNPLQEELARIVESTPHMALSTSDLGQVAQIEIGRMEFSAIQRRVTFDSGHTDVLNAAAISSAGIIIAVGASGRIVESDDFGATWTTRTADVAYAGTFNAIVWSQGAGLFIAVGNSGEIQTSPNGTTWTHRTSGTGVNLTGVCDDASNIVGLVVAVGSSGVNLHSPSGTSWSAGTAINSGTFNARGIACKNGIYSVVGDPGAADPTKSLYVSNTGTTWAVVNLTGIIGGTDTLQEISVRGDHGWAMRNLTAGGVNEILSSGDASPSTFLLSPTLTSSVTRVLLCGRALVGVGIAAGYDASNWRNLGNLPGAGTTRAVYLEYRPAGSNPVADTALWLSMFMFLNTTAGGGNGKGYVTALIAP